MNRQAKLLMMLGSVFFAACASSPQQPLAEPVIVHTDTDAATLLALNPYQATHVKIGARWFPRCQVFTSLGSRTDTQTACLTDTEIHDLVERQNQLQQDFTTRSATCVGACGGS